jgi:hypothetical protein
MRIYVKENYFYDILVLCSSSSWGMRFLVGSSHALNLVVVTCFLDVSSVPPGLWCNLNVGLVLSIRRHRYPSLVDFVFLT